MKKERLFLTKLIIKSKNRKSGIKLYTPVPELLPGIQGVD